MSEDSKQLSDAYLRREQTLVKHTILKKYLERFAHIIGSRWDTITYVDCFSGPWGHRTTDYSDTSFSIAVQELHRAVQTHTEKGRKLTLRCMFLEQDRKAFRELEGFKKTEERATIEIRNAPFEESISEIRAFVNQGGPNSFPFIFIDPWGVKAIPLETIRPLLLVKPSEVLINFMTGHISRFVDAPDPAIRDTFDKLYGGSEFRATLEGKAGRDREDSLVSCYLEAIRKSGKFKYACAAVVLQPEKDRVHHHLIYATRHHLGVQVFKEAERRGTNVMDRARFDAHQRKQVGESGQSLFDFGSDFAPSGAYIDELRKHYLNQAELTIRQQILAARIVRYRDCWCSAMRFPLVWEKDVKSWIKLWQESNVIRLKGLGPREKTPKIDKEHFIELVTDF